MSLPKSILIVGGSGKVSRHLTRQLAQQGVTVYSIIRKEEQVADLKSLGATPIVQSIEHATVTDLAKTFGDNKPEVIVWSAGAGGGDPERTNLVDRQAALKSFSAASMAGVKRFILVSALDVRDRKKPTPGWYNDEDRDRSRMLWQALEPYMQAKFDADKALVTRNKTEYNLDYTIVRPGGLNMEPAKGTVECGKVHLSAMVSREDVAQVIIECIKNPGTIGKAFDVVGGHMYVQEAVNKVVHEKIDNFEGFY